MLMRTIQGRRSKQFSVERIDIRRRGGSLNGGASLTELRDRTSRLLHDQTRARRRYILPRKENQGSLKEKNHFPKMKAHRPIALVYIQVLQGALPNGLLLKCSLATVYDLKSDRSKYMA